jgi:glucose-1-phosphate thymidylyltransferase
MKGVILAGGSGTRLLPMTKITNKHLLPVYDRPMIMYPIDSLIALGINDIMIISGKGHAGHFLELLSSGKSLGISLSYAVQEEAGGIAQALALAEDFADTESIAVILGDNIFEDPLDIAGFSTGARLFLKEVSDPQRFGVAEVRGTTVVSIEEKPPMPKSSYAVSGFYVYDNSVFTKIKNIKPSPRGELEITDVNNLYITEGSMDARFIKGFWTDAGTIESLYHASTLVRDKKLNAASTT